jgi:uncharacterized membrane protein HdeD (DUF308 family)
VEGLVYILCAGTAAVCAALLARGYRRSRARLLFWCALFFLALVVENSILFADHITVPELDLKPYRRVVGLIGVCGLVYGLVWESDRRTG